MSISAAVKSYAGASKTIAVWAPTLYPGSNCPIDVLAGSSAATADAPVYDLAQTDILDRLGRKVHVTLDVKLLELPAVDVPLLSVWEDASNYLDILLDYVSSSTFRVQIGDFVSASFTAAKDHDYRLRFCVTNAGAVTSCVLLDRTAGTTVVDATGTATFSGLEPTKVRLGCLNDGSGQRWILLRGLEAF